MKKTFEVIGFLSLILFTFFYTSKITTVIKENDDLLIQLKEYQEQYKESAIDAVIIDNKISAGLSGSEINIKESYEKMKKVNSFNANLLVYEKIKPNISVLDYHDKYIVKGKKESVSLVFLVEQTSDIEKILNILDNYDVKATFYIDGNWFENNNEKVIELIENNHTVGNLGYNYNYDVNGISWMNTIVTNIGKQKYTYCYLEEENDDFLNICKNNKSYTIIPSIIVKTNPLITIKKSLENGSIISLKINNSTIIELPLIIEYINSRNLNIINLEELLDE